MVGVAIIEAAQIPGQHCTKNCAVQGGFCFTQGKFGSAAGPLHPGAAASEGSSRNDFRFGS